MKQEAGDSRRCWQPCYDQEGPSQDEAEAVMAKGRVKGAGNLPAPGPLSAVLLPQSFQPWGGASVLLRARGRSPGALGLPVEGEGPRWRLGFLLARRLSYATRTQGWQLRSTEKVKPKDKASLERSSGQFFPSFLTPVQWQREPPSETNAWSQGSGWALPAAPRRSVTLG